MPMIFRNRVVTLSEPTDKMNSAELRDFINMLKRFSGGPRIDRKIRDLEAELEWRRVTHSKKPA